MSTDLWQFLIWPTRLSYLTWACVWCMVTFYYIGASWDQWRRIHPGSTRGPVMLWLYVVFASALRPVGSIKNPGFSTPIDRDKELFPRGLMLQLGIASSGACSTILGILIFNNDRTGTPVVKFALLMTMITLSTIGGMIHLFPPLRSQGRIVLWRSMMIGSWLLPLIGFTVAGVAYHLMR